MKRLIVVALLAAGLFVPITSNANGQETPALPPAGKSKLNVVAEEKAGTYRESNLGAFLLGRCRRTTSLCMIIFHDDGQPSGTAKVFYENGSTAEYKFNNYTENYYFDATTEEEGTEFLFELK